MRETVYNCYCHDEIAALEQGSDGDSEERLFVDVTMLEAMTENRLHSSEQR